MLDLTSSEIEKRIGDSYELPNEVFNVVPEPLVSVRTSAYQHSSYIKECIESVLMQKTTFPIEFIIGEDFSTDGTREIVFEYAEKYPDIIRVITADYNVGMKANGTRCIRAIRGQYMAICEGDDFWTDPYKLQKQVDFLKAHPECSMCHTDANILRGSRLDPVPFNKLEIPKFASTEDLIKLNFIITCSALYRMDCINIPEWASKLGQGDWTTFLFCAEKGPVGYLEECTAVYRRHEGGVWSGVLASKKHELVLNSLLKYVDFFPDKYTELLNSRVAETRFWLAYDLAREGGSRKRGWVLAFGSFRQIRSEKMIPKKIIMKTWILLLVPSAALKVIRKLKNRVLCRS